VGIKEITSQSAWTQLLNQFGSPTFLQSWEWGEVQKKLGYEVLRLKISDCAVAQVIKIKAKRGSMLFVPHGPIFDKRLTSNIKQLAVAHESLLVFLKEVAQKESYAFIRIAPILVDNPSNRYIFKALGFHTSPIYMHAERVWVLDITKSEEELLRKMRKTTRYSIRKAEKEGVTIEKYPMSNNQSPISNRHFPIINLQSPIDLFWSIYEETANREGFTPFSKSFLQHEFDEFNRHDNALFLFGKINGKTEAAALVDFTKSTGFYHQGATSHHKVPVSYLLQWEAIREAKKRGCTHYNFWGTLQPGRTPKNWHGLSLFKQGFGGYQVDYVPTQDYIINPLKYFLSYLYEQYLKWHRGV
jgi:lipid II:glycine glycyltransferase (peptidoglycan interpeptide bridge formation enzyme)